MIFLSHNSKDKPIVRQVAEALEKIFKRENIFYDEWSIQPGDSIIDKMDKGLTSCKYFLFFISENSLKSQMVEMEWQSALIKKAKENIKFIPIRMDRSIIPQILTRTLYIDLYSYGLEASIRQIVDVISGQNTYTNNNIQFSNIVGYVKKELSKIIVEFRAEYYMEPISSYLIFVDNDENDFTLKLPYKSEYSSRFYKNFKFSGSEALSTFLFIGDSQATAPNYPFVVELIPKNNKEIKILGLDHKKSNTDYAPIPMKILV